MLRCNNLMNLSGNNSYLARPRRQADRDRKRGRSIFIFYAKLATRLGYFALA